MPLMRPESLFDAAGPTAVQVSCESGLAGSCVKIRKLVEASSLLASPSPLLGTGLLKVIDQELRMPVVLAEVTISSFHCPAALVLRKALSSDSCGLNRPKNG